MNGIAWQDVVATLTRGDEAFHKQVSDLYTNCLGRVPDEPGHASFTDALRQGASLDVVFARIAGYAEARERSMR